MKVLFSTAVLMVVSLRAGTIVVPGALTNTEGNTNNLVPFALGSAFFAPNITGRYQQVYSAAEFTAFGASLLSGVNFRLDGIFGSSLTGIQFENVLITLSITSKAVDALDTTFANNLTSPATTVYSGVLHFPPSANSGSPRPFDMSIPLQTFFLYDPTLGNLLLDISIIQGGDFLKSTSNLPTFDAQNSVGDSVSRVWAISSSATGWQATSGTVDTIGLVTQFTTAPEPSTLSFCIGGAIGMIAITLWRRDLPRPDLRVWRRS